MSVEVHIATIAEKLNSIDDKICGIVTNVKDQGERLTVIEAFINQIKGGWYATILLASVSGTIAGILGTLILKFLKI